VLFTNFQNAVFPPPFLLLLFLPFIFFFFFSFLLLFLLLLLLPGVWGLNSGTFTCQADMLSLEPHTPALFAVFFK
jgi:hypothetical protein